nr:hypothetical protein CFP56_53563 [Quercus suber]
MSADRKLPTSTRNTISTDIHNIQRLVQRYVRQLLDGCGSHECKSSMCDTGRRNISPDKPVRKWTPRSARAIAIAIASCPNPSRHVCPFMLDSRLEQSSSSEGPQDPSSFTQRLSDTRAIRNFCTPGSMLHQKVESMNDRAHHVLDPVVVVDRIDHSSTSIISNQQAVARVMLNIRYLLSMLPRHPVALHRHALFHVLEGRAAPANVEHIPVDKRWEIWMKILDGHAYEPSLRLLSRITQIYSLRKSLDDAVWKATTEQARYPRVLANHRSRHFAVLLGPQIDAIGNDSQVHLYVWLHQIFFLHWDGSALVQPGTSCCGALEMFSLFNTTQALPTISSHLDTIKVVRSWIQWWDSPSTARHLLHFPKLFTLKERIVYLRMMNHLRMQDRVMAAEKTAHLVRRVAPLEYQVQGALEYATEQYLLLSVSRDNVLRDAYNQLWQRRKSELLRPLRVRLGEIDELEIGQDLGGVQIEFFNLVCKHAFAEESRRFRHMTSQP